MAGARPERSCVGCRGRAPKADLLRVVRTPSVCGWTRSARRRDEGRTCIAIRACVTAAVRRGALVRALRVGLAEEELARLRNDIEEALPAT